ncbi:hypothetical protein D3C87_2181420 [compost metagenome]
MLPSDLHFSRRAADSSLFNFQCIRYGFSLFTSFFKETTIKASLAKRAIIAAVNLLSLLFFIVSGIKSEMEENVS